MIPLLCSQIPQRQKVERWLPGAGGGENEELVFQGDSVYVWEDEKVLVMGPQHCDSN